MTKTKHSLHNLAIVALISVFAFTSNKTYSQQNNDIITIEQLEQKIHVFLNALETDAEFTLMIRADNGRSFVHSTGSSTPTTVYRSASTSKWVTATIILSLVDQGIMDLDDNPQQYIPNWSTTGRLSQIKLRQLLGFTSGLSEDVNCVNNPLRRFSVCIKNIARANRRMPEPGSEFHYNSSHLQVAGAMAMYARNTESWETVFQQFQAATGLFNQASYDLPSKRNPRLAGGMHWTAVEYLAFLQAIYEQTILSPQLINLMTQDQLQTANIVKTPTVAINEDWHYGFGNWIECHNQTFNCPERTKVSSPGAYGTYPFIDYQYRYYGILAREGRLGSFAKGYTAFTNVEPLLKQWALMNQH